MRLEELLLDRDFGDVAGKDSPTVEIIGLTADSREVKPGFLVAALPVTNNDGRDFILEAVEAGAIVILADENTDVILKNETQCRLITDKNPRKRYAEIAGAFYRIQPKTIAAVTGTNGKSSVAEFTRQIWQRSNKKCASLGTLGLVSQNEHISSHLTTPDPAELHKVLSRLSNDNINNLIIEASSHGLDQCRLDGTKISIAAMTNLSRDHLDYHKTVKEYYAAKFRLFSELLDPDGIAVVNADDPMVGKVLDILHRRGIKYFDFGETANDIRLQKVESFPEYQELYLYIFGRKIEIRFPLIG